MARRSPTVSSAANGGGGTTKQPSAASVRKMQGELESLQSILDRTKGLKKQFDANKSAMMRSTLMVGESAAVAGLSSVASGAAGKYRTHVRVARGITALGALGWGLSSILGSKNGDCGHHQMAVASGLINAESAETGLMLGAKARQWWADRAAASAGADGAAAGNGAPAPEVVVTPSASTQGEFGRQPALLREVLPENDELAAFRAKGRARPQHAV